MKQYYDLVEKILSTGEKREDRTGTGTLSIFGGQLEFDLTQRFPLVTLKKTRWRDAFIEMLWFLSGEDNTSFLKQYGVKIWDDWADSVGNVGPIYGVQWRKWKKTMQLEMVIDNNGERNYKATYTTIDQIADLIQRIKVKPFDRRLIVSAWNPGEIELMSLPPCHRDFQCYVSVDGYLDLMMAIRSWDVGLGGPYNIAQYAFLTHLLARATNLKPRRLKINYGDAHLYNDHVPLFYEWLNVHGYKPVECDTQLVVNTENTDIDGYNIDDFDIVNYESNPFLKLPISV